MKDDLPRRLRQKVVRTDNNGQSYPASRNMDGDEAAGEIERLIAELAALRENSLAVLTRVRAYRDKVITERDALRALMQNVVDDDHYHLLAERTRARIETALNKGGGDE